MFFFHFGLKFKKCDYQKSDFQRVKTTEINVPFEIAKPVKANFNRPMKWHEDKQKHNELIPQRFFFLDKQGSLRVFGEHTLRRLNRHSAV